jgi:hypothetical protein
MMNRVAERHEAGEPALPYLLSGCIHGHAIGRGNAGIAHHPQRLQRYAEAIQALAEGQRSPATRTGRT